MKSKKLNESSHELRGGQQVDTSKSMAIATLKERAAGLSSLSIWTAVFALLNAGISMAGLANNENATMANLMLWIAYALLLVSAIAAVKRFLTLREVHQLKANIN